MDFAIIAAGEGSRLAQSGYPYPKPLAQLQGMPLIERLITIFSRHGAGTIHIIINEEMDSLAQYLQTYVSAVPLRVIRKTTPSSLHSLYELLKGTQVEDLCLTTVDTIFREEEFDAYLQAFMQNPEVDAWMGVTSFVEDESPLYVETDTKGKVSAFSDVYQEQDPLLVSGGIYTLRKGALNCVEKAIQQGVKRMRNYQRMLLEEHLNVQAFTFGKIIDIDHLTDLEIAEKWLREEAVS